MSFGFGSNNNNASTFGGFGSSNTGGGFGANTNTTSGGSLFGGNTATSGGFGSTGGGFGSTNNNSPFGASKPAFGAPATTTSGGGLFGNNTSTSGGFGSGGGFGSTTNTAGGFGSTTGGGLFGQTKPATGGFGSTNTGGSLFGGGSTTGGFGASTNTGGNPFGTNTAANTNTSFGPSNTGNSFAFGASSNTAANNNNNNSGTGGTPFQATTEKEGATGQVSSYQSVTFQAPYSNKSFEELRTEDYAQGRIHGNSNGQAGSFGQSTGFGGFGANTNSTGGGAFGGNTATSGSTGFGASSGGFGSTNTAGGFGSNTNTGGGLFGNQNKPAGGLFGAQSSAPSTGGFGSTSGSGGGLFGGGGGFGTNTNTNQSGGGLFGGNTQTQNKPAFGGFGSTTNTGGGFGSNTNTGGGLFGNSANTNSNAGGGLFGNQNNQPQGGGLFGQSNATTGGGLFGSQNKPATTGLFGSSTNTSNTGGGLFGAQNPQQPNNAFGQSANTGGGLFGNQNQNKPAGGSLFGGANTNTGGGLFGSQNNQPSGSNLFGGSNANTGSTLFGNQNKPTGGLFGSNTNTGNGTSLFGGNQQVQQGNTGSTLFGGMNNNQNQQSTNNNSLFGGSFNQSQQGQPPNQLRASLTNAPYGNEQLFSSLAAPSPPVGPLATPLSGARAAPRKTPSLLASARLNTPVYSPRGGSIGRAGYGFSYSTYGTPGSAFTSGSLTPGASSLLKPTGSLSSALTSRLNKSFSTSNLRGDSTASEGRSLLRPSAFSPEGSASRYPNGNVRKLKIDRSLRTDLFGPAESKAIEAVRDNDGPALKKRVSFENAPKDQTTSEPNATNALVRTEDQDDNSSPGLMRAGPSKAGPNGRAPEMEQVSGSLTTVPEDVEAPRPASAPSTRMPAEKSRRGEIGDYFTKPAMKDLRNMSRQQLKNVGNFVVGRDGVGRIEFGSVDLTNTPLDDICGTIVQLTPRSATVYQDDHDKPSMGKALNVPSTIYLENSWPRSQGGKKTVNTKSGKEYDKHIQRLKRVNGTHFQSYNPDTGVWCFKVDHFTTYGLDDDDDESEFPDDSRTQEDSSALSEPPETPNAQRDDTLQGMDTDTGEMDDTFQFKLDKRPQLPGGFESQFDSYSHDNTIADETMHEGGHVMSGGLGEAEMEDPFTSPGGPVQAPSPGAVERYHSSMMEDDDQGDLAEELEQEIPGAFAAEPRMPRSILKPSTGLAAFQSPEKLATEAWEEQLQRTISPKKRDRQALKDMQQSLLQVREEDVVESPFKQSTLGQSFLGQSYLAQKSAKKAKQTLTKNELGKSQTFRTAMDLMDSMYAPDKANKKTGADAKGFEYPYPKKPRLSDMPGLRPKDAEWHDSMKPSFATNGTLVYSAPGSAPQVSGEMLPAITPIVGEHKDVRFAKFASVEDINSLTLAAQNNMTTIDTSSGFPIALAPSDVLFAEMANHVDENLSIADHELAIWRLCSVLFDPLENACAEFIDAIPQDKIEEFAPRMRLDALGAYWAQIVTPFVTDGLKRARTAEEKALLHLTQNDNVAACEALMKAGDYKLATLIVQLPGTEASRSMMKTQLAAWRSRNDWSEMSEPVRALYSILAGDLCIVEGKSGAAENRVADFNIAERFGLSWQQSFALRLYFGGHQSVAEVVDAYTSDLETKKDSIPPEAHWSNDEATGDTLMSLLKLSASSVDLAKMFDPSAVSGSKVNSRLTWQLAVLLSANGHCTLGTELLDHITYSFAVELEAAGELVRSAWTILHLRDGRTRQRAVLRLLERNGDKISTPSQADNRGNFEELLDDLHIPASMMWKAKALYAKAGLQDAGLQTEWLVRAGEVDAAHEVLCTTLGPQAVIEQDHEGLSHVLDLFSRRSPHDWDQGGRAYADFLRLVRSQSGQRRNRDMQAAIQGLQRSLPRMKDDLGSKKTLEERVAVIEMGRVLDETLREQGDGGKDHEMSGMESVGGAEMLSTYRNAMGVMA